ncbi:ABC transporter substrate-binding protein [Halobacteriovorax sp. HLS]|uniref:substrate-binding periplasmic protein n=1 Tax=Halobacteriovorax sp. HLS TaxID=2234000 RepID=UPI000FD937B3|nr:ABC transporter substrate-binding protein [Halobacteriovorax sp. HLS]
MFKIGISLLFLFTLNSYSASLPLGIHEFPPFVSTTFKGNGLIGFFVDYIFKKGGVDTAISSHRRGALQGDLIDSGKYFGVFPFLKNSSRSTDVVYSNSLLTAQYVFIHRKGLDTKGVNFQTYEGLSKFKIGILTSDLVYNQVKAVPKLNLETVRGAKELVSKISSRSLDIIVFEKTSWNYLARESNVVGLEDYVLSNGPWPSFDVYMIISKKYPDYEKYLNILNSGIAQYDLNKMIIDHFY